MSAEDEWHTQDEMKWLQYEWKRVQRIPSALTALTMCRNLFLEMVVRLEQGLPEGDRSWVWAAPSHEFAWLFARQWFTGVLPIAPTRHRAFGFDETKEETKPLGPVTSAHEAHLLLSKVLPVNAMALPRPLTSEPSFSTDEPFHRFLRVAESDSSQEAFGLLGEDNKVQTSQKELLVTLFDRYVAHFHPEPAPVLSWSVVLQICYAHGILFNSEDNSYQRFRFGPITEQMPIIHMTKEAAEQLAEIHNDPELKQEAINLIRAKLEVTNGRQWDTRW